jgi:hypothetical protein
MKQLGHAVYLIVVGSPFKAQERHGRALIFDVLGASSAASFEVHHPGYFHSHIPCRNEYQKRVEFICYQKVGKIPRQLDQLKGG